jgi:hypothetical protein
MAFSNSESDLKTVIALTTFLGDADNILREQTVAQTTYAIEDVKVATTTALLGSPSYSPGTSGVGAYLQATSYLSGSGKLSIDTIVMEPGFRILVKDQADPEHNGVYKVTTEGGPSTYYRITRVEDFDQTSEIKNYTKIKVTLGSTNQNKTFFLSSGGDPTVGTTELVFSQFPGDATSQFLLSEFRKQFDDLKSENEFDNAATVINNARATEINLPVSINNQFLTVCSSLNTFYFNQYASNFKTYFKDAYATGVFDTDLGGSALSVWTDNFRTLWRKTQNEELVVRLGYVQKAVGSTGVWGAFTADKSIELNSNLIVKIKSDLEEADIPISANEMPITITLSDADGNPYVVTVNVPVGSLADDTFSITSTVRTSFAAIEDVTISNLYGGTGQPIVEFWVSAT